MILLSQCIFAIERVNFDLPNRIDPESVEKLQELRRISHRFLKREVPARITAAVIGAATLHRGVCANGSFSVERDEAIAHLQDVHD
jgi:hypothetical protein